MPWSSFAAYHEIVGGVLNAEDFSTENVLRYKQIQIPYSGEYIMHLPKNLDSTVIWRINTYVQPQN